MKRAALSLCLLLLAPAADAQLLRRPQLNEVIASQQRWAYLDVVLKNADHEWRFFFLPTEDCTFLMKTENVVEWAPSGPFGRFRLLERECTPVGVGSLRLWRDRRGRQGDPRGVPRGRSDFRVVWQDEEWVMVLGRLPFAARIGFTGGERAVAMVPNIPDCQPVLERGHAMLEFRRGGQEPFRFSAGRDQRCLIEAFIQAPPQSQVDEPS